MATAYGCAPAPSQCNDGSSPSGASYEACSGRRIAIYQEIQKRKFIFFPFLPAVRRDFLMEFPTSAEVKTN